MSLLSLPAVNGFDRIQNFQPEAPSDIYSQWAERPCAAASDDPNTIDIFEVIGEDFWTGGGMTDVVISERLKAIGPKPITVKINSPGGDVFDGISIYNLLAEHPAKVTVHVMGMAASAASLIAMAGDEIRMGTGSFMMVHNAWGGVRGNRHDFAEAVALFEKIDGALADVYEARTGGKRDEIVALMDEETFLTAQEAVALGFADIADASLKSSEASASMNSSVNARRRLDGLLAPSASRSKRRRLLKEATGGMRDAAPPATQDAGVPVAALKRLIETMKS